jgi:Glycosyl transferases group 1
VIVKSDGIFVSASLFLSDRPGGAQACTKEYISTLAAAGVSLDFCPHELDARFSAQLLRKVWRSSYFRLVEPGLLARVRAAVERNNAQFVFLNQVQLAPLAPSLRSVLPSNCKIVALSHGLESTDLLHALRLRNELPIAVSRYFMGKRLLGDTLLRECSYRPSLDLVLCLSPFDVELERWLGARKVDWLPRTCTPNAVAWEPRGNRMGFVGTLDHGPTLEGLVLFLRSVSNAAPEDIRVRIVGSPKNIGHSLVKHFPVVDYLGPLTDDELEREAITWNCFVHPIFCHPRGSSTKLATAIAWQIPIVTTSSGQRGYVWERGRLGVAEDPGSLARLALSMMNIEVARQAREQVSKIAHSSPTIADVGQKVASLLRSD